MAIDIIARGMIESSNGNISQLSEKVSNHTDNSDIHVTVSDKENWNSHPNDVTTSGNPVQIDGLQGGVPFSEIAVSGKNLIPYPYYETTKTVNGITFTDNGDGSITINGTATANTNLWLYPYAKDYMHLNEDVSYFLSGNCCTSGEVIISLGFYSGSTWIKAENDIGNGKSFRISHNSNYDSICLSIFVKKNAVCDYITVYPQLELGETATTYEPSIQGRELTVNVSGKNLMKYPYFDTNKTVNGVTYTVNGDGTITMNGTSTDKSYFYFTHDVSKKIYPAGKYTISGMPKNSIIDLRVLNIDDSTVIANDIGNSASFVLTKPAPLRIYLYFGAGKTFDNVTIYPQLELGDTTTPYEPYHGAEYTITPTSNPYVIPNDIRQVDGLNVVSVSEGEISVTGVQKNAAVKKIWDKMGMDLLFDGVTSADNPAVIDLANYNMIRIDVGGNFEGTSYFNCGSTYFLKSTLDYAVTSYGRVAMAMSNQAVVINISKSGADYSLSFTGFNAKQLVEVIKIFGIK